MNTNLVIREDASDSILWVMIWGVTSLLMTRLYLNLTDYPVIGRGYWHVSHAATGGLIMVMGVILMVIFHGSAVKKVSLTIFGVGTGWFIDEIGKYLTKDNNYFFQPAIIFIYVFFVLLFLLYRYLRRIQKQDNETLFYSVLGRLEEVARNDLERGEKEIIIRRLQRIIETEKEGNMKRMSRGILKSIMEMRAKRNEKHLGIQTRVKGIIKVSYDKIIRRRLVIIGLWSYSIYYALDKIIDILRISTSRQKVMMIERFYRDYNIFGQSDVYLIILQMVFDMVASILFLLGARYFWSKKRLRGIRFFKYGLYVSILLSSIFRFYFEQFRAMYELVISIIVLAMLNEYRKELTAK